MKAFVFAVRTVANIAIGRRAAAARTADCLGGLPEWLDQAF
jgi:hypothetical protein